MIDKEDCCDNCEEGIEPCCDELLQQHIEEQLDEHSEPEQQSQFIKEEKAYDNTATELAKHLCCQNKFYIIYRVMETMNAEQLNKLRNDLRSFTPKNQLHPQLESKFRHYIARLDSVQILDA